MIDVLLLGNPNTGKTTLYNALTGQSEHTGNWCGVTVEERAHIYSYKGTNIRIVDLPGIYSLTPLSFEEEVATNYIYSHPNDIIVNICDASNLQRNLYLTVGLLEMGAKVVLAINQIEKRPVCKIDFAKLAQILDVPVVYVNPAKKEGLEKLNQQIVDYCQMPKKTQYKNLDLSKARDFLSKFNINDDFFAIKLLEKDEKLLKSKNIDIGLFDQPDDSIMRVAKARYDFVDDIVAKVCSKRTRVQGKSKLDKILLNRFWGIPIFFLLMAGVFYTTFFSLGKFLSNMLVMFLDTCLTNPIISFLQPRVSAGVLNFFETALFGGVGSVLGFLPQVVLLFFFLALMEDSGYLSRVAFLADDLLSKVGLSGKSVYTLLMGFGCATSALLTARNMENKNAKTKTAFATPYTSCSAKFPIYAVLGGAFFGADNVFVILGLYVLGLAMAVFVSWLGEKTFLKSGGQSFILEFPPYLAPSAKRIGSVLGSNTKDFLLRVGSIIVATNVVVWVLANFSFAFRYVGGQGESILQTLGRVLGFVFVPLGFSSWGLVSALMAGLVAKEVVLSSVYMFSGVVEGDTNLLLSALTNPASPVYFSSTAAVLSFLAFCLLYFPCLSSVSVLAKEIGVKQTAIGCAVQFVVAYVVAFVVYRLALIGFFNALLLICAVAILTAGVVLIQKAIKNKCGCKGCPKCNGKCKK